MKNKFPFNRLSEDLRTPSGNQHIQLHWPQAIEGHLIRPTQEDPLFLLMPLRLQFMGRPTTGIPHPLEQKTPVNWFSKKQPTLAIATYGSKTFTARTCIEQVVDLRNTLRHPGVLNSVKSCVFADNGFAANSSMQPDGKLHKRHNLLSFHYVREVISRGFVVFTHIPGADNPADILSKHWGYSDIWPLLKALLFWQGDTMDIDGP